MKGRKIDGKPLFGYIYGYIYAEVKAALTQAKAAAYHDGQIRIIGKGSLAEFLAYWLENIKGRVKASTYAQYYERVYTHITPALGHIQVCRLTREQAQGFVDGLSKKGLSPSTVKNITGILRSAMKKTVELRLVSGNPCAGLTLPKDMQDGRGALCRAEQVRLEKLLPQGDSGTELGVMLALYAGLRIGEICALRRRDIDLFTGTLTVRGTLQRMKNLGETGPKTILAEGLPKSARSMRKIPLPADLTDMLARKVEDIPDTGYILSGCETPVEPHTFRARFNKMAAKAGLDMPFHSLRHTFVTRCLEHSFDIQTVSELLGHASSAITLKTYAHSLLEHKRLLIDRIRILSEYYEPSNKPSAADPAQ